MGPPFIGYLADVFTNLHLVANTASETLNAKCSFIDPNLSEALRNSCQAAKTYGMKFACVIASLFFTLSGVIYIVSGRYFKKDTLQA